MERNNLMSKCYPRIKDYCREKHGLEFQVRKLAFIDRSAEDKYLRMSLNFALSKLRKQKSFHKKLSESFLRVSGIIFNFPLKLLKFLIKKLKTQRKSEGQRENFWNDENSGAKHSLARKICLQFAMEIAMNNNYDASDYGNVFATKIIENQTQPKSNLGLFT